MPDCPDPDHGTHCRIPWVFGWGREPALQHQIVHSIVGKKNINIMTLPLSINKWWFSPIIIITPKYWYQDIIVLIDENKGLSIKSKYF